MNRWGSGWRIGDALELQLPPFVCITSLIAKKKSNLSNLSSIAISIKNPHDQTTPSSQPNPRPPPISHLTQYCNTTREATERSLEIWERCDSELQNTVRFWDEQLLLPRLQHKQTRPIHPHCSSLPQRREKRDVQSISHVKIRCTQLPRLEAERQNSEFQNTFLNSATIAALEAERGICHIAHSIKERQIKEMTTKGKSH